MKIKNPPVISKFGITTEFNVEDRFKDHPLLEKYNLQVIFSGWFPKDEANEIENEFLQRYPRIKYDFEMDGIETIDGHSEMRYIDEAIVNKIRKELYDLRGDNTFKSIKEQKQFAVKVYFVQFAKK
jgi:hypothetical protein